MDRSAQPGQWLRQLIEGSEDGGSYRAVDMGAVLEQRGRLQRRRVLAIAVATSVGLAGAVAIWLPRRGTAFSSSASGHYEASSTAEKTPTSGTATARKTRAGLPAGTARPPRVLATEAKHDTAPQETTAAPQETTAATLGSGRDGMPSRPRPAQRRVLQQESATTTTTELLARAQAARAAHDADSARAALLEIRTRFPASPAVGRATFLLGRVELELVGDTKNATRWFERYVAEYPHGGLAAQARGRVLQQLAGGGGERAASAAADYLEHHPEGPYAGLARRVGEGP